MKKIFVLTLVLVVAMTSLLAIPASAVFVTEVFSRPNCGCSNPFYGEYSGGVTENTPDRASAWAYVEHVCDSASAYVSLKCWIAPLNNMSNYTSRTFTDSGTDNGLGIEGNGSNPGIASAGVTQNYTTSVYALLGVENYYRVSVTHNGAEYTKQAWSSDGDVPLSYNPPVVTE